MSEVVATILLLALTVVLFASIFAFVSAFPAPPAQNSSQFQASLVSAPNGTGAMVETINIIHLAGASVPDSALIYLKSALYPKGPEFASPYSLTAGGIPSGRVWNLGQTWSLSTNFTGSYHPILPDNITVYILSSSSLLFSVVLPGSVTSAPPTFLSVGTVPTVPVVGGAFTIDATIANVVSTNTVTITVSGLPFAAQPTGVQKMKYSGGVWTYGVLAGNTNASGTYYAFITATGSTGKTGNSAVPVYITPYSTLIGSALSISSTVPATVKCTAAKTPVAACQASGQYSYALTITSSSVNFGSVQFEVLTSTGAVLGATGAGAFAVSTTTTPDGSWATTATTVSMIMPSTGFSTYAVGFSSSSPLTTSYVISIDMGTVDPAGAGDTFVVLGIGSYSGQTTPITLT